MILSFFNHEYLSACGNSMEKSTHNGWKASLFQKMKQCNAHPNFATQLKCSKKSITVKLISRKCNNILHIQIPLELKVIKEFNYCKSDLICTTHRLVFEGILIIVQLKFS